MKKKQVNLNRKLFLQKNLIGTLTITDTRAVLGGATLAGDTSPCGPCTGPTYTCPTALNCPPPKTNLTLSNPCCGF
ncbi:class I lanthipeptide [Taibaiella chishuiensis]|uniref:Uncharacterized protein n=1 Tax=Taibaiella chishuiensis TaxID=1434707 RepID=A0A2P8D1N2_9BACT|nr:hypothetical protein B0I18_106151 [Taibaiella chishuiensis]